MFGFIGCSGGSKFGFGLKRDVGRSSKFGSNVQRTLRTFGGHKTPHFLANLTDLFETIFNENKLK